MGLFSGNAQVTELQQKLEQAKDHIQKQQGKLNRSQRREAQARNYAVEVQAITNTLLSELRHAYSKAAENLEATVEQFDKDTAEAAVDEAGNG